MSQQENTPEPHWLKEARRRAKGTPHTLPSQGASHDRRLLLAAYDEVAAALATTTEQLAAARQELGEQEAKKMRLIEELARVRSALSHYIERFSEVGGFLIRATRLMGDAARQLTSFVAGEGDRYATDTLLEAIAITLTAIENDEPAAPAQVAVAPPVAPVKGSEFFLNGDPAINPFGPR